MTSKVETTAPDGQPVQGNPGFTQAARASHCGGDDGSVADGSRRSITPRLSGELTQHLAIRQALMEAVPDIDDETLEDTLEGVTDLKEMLFRIVRSQLEDSDFCNALRARLSEMKSRLDRLESRVIRKRQLVADVMDRAQIKKLQADDVTVSVRPVAPPLVIIDNGEIPKRFWRPQPPKLDRKALLAALKDDQAVPGALLGNGGITLTVRTK